MPNYFIRQPSFRFKPASVLVFIAAAIIAWIIHLAGQMVFPSQNLVPYIARTTITVAVDLALIYVSFRLLKQNGLPKEALGLSVSTKTLSDIFRGTVIGAATVAVIAGVLFLYAPYHFVRGSIDGTQALKTGIYYLSGNSLEELMFRGFLFILISQRASWPVSALVMALPFGLFHLQWTGPSADAWKLVATTACYSFVFSLSYVLFRSMWVSIMVHVVSNIFLHTITGLDGAGNAIFQPVAEGNWTKGYDLSFIVAIWSAVIMSAVLLLLVAVFNKKDTSAIRTNPD